MKARTVAGLGVVALSMSLAAALSVSLRDGAGAVDRASGMVLPGLADRMDRVAVIRVEDARRRITLRRRDGAWAIEQRDGFEADPGRVRDLALSLSRLEKLEPRTRDPRNHARLHLRDVRDAASKARRITLADADGRSVAALLVGKPAPALGPDALFVRQPDEARCWLASGRLEAAPRAIDWIAPRILTLDPGAVRRLVIRHPDGEIVGLSRPAPGTPMRLADPPPGRTEGPADVLDAPAQALGGLSLDDVRRADRIPFDPDRTLRLAAETFAGTLVRLSLTRHDGGDWVRLSVVGAGGDPEAHLARAAARADGWLFRLSPATAQRFRVRRHDLTAPGAILGAGDEPGQQPQKQQEQGFVPAGEARRPM